MSLPPSQMLASPGIRASDQAPAEPRAEDGRDGEPGEQAEEHDPGRVQGRRGAPEAAAVGRAQAGLERVELGRQGPEVRRDGRRVGDVRAQRRRGRARSADSARASAPTGANSPASSANGRAPRSSNAPSAARLSNDVGEPRREHRRLIAPPRRSRSGSRPRSRRSSRRCPGPTEAGPSIARSSARWRSKPVAASSTAASEPRTRAPPRPGAAPARTRRTRAARARAGGDGVRLVMPVWSPLRSLGAQLPPEEHPARRRAGRAAMPVSASELPRLRDRAAQHQVLQERDAVGDRQQRRRRPGSPAGTRRSGARSR